MGQRATTVFRVRAHQLGDQWQLHRMGWRRVRSLRGLVRARHLALLLSAPVLGSLLVVLAVRATAPMTESGADLVSDPVLVLALLAAVALVLVGCSLVIGGVPASTVLACAQRGRVWASPELDACATVTRVMRGRRRIHSHYSAGPGGAGLRWELVVMLVHGGHTVEIKADDGQVAALYEAEIAARGTDLDRAGVLVARIGARRWSFRPRNGDERL